jgi:hypothetical protein
MTRQAATEVLTMPPAGSAAGSAEGSRHLRKVWSQT